MITKNTFVHTMNRLQELDRKMSEVDAALQNLSPDFCSFYIPDVFDLAIDILQEVMEDKDNWLGYFVYENDWLRNLKLGDVEVDGESVEIKSWADVYDFITKE